jgi:ABC-2 type transport system permease protein
MIAAILRAQWLSMRRVSSRSLVVNIIAGVLWYGVWMVVAAAVGTTVAFASDAQLRRYLPLGMLAAMAYWQLMPVLSASMGSSLDLRKLLAYPLPHARLFFIEVVLRITTAVEMMLVLLAAFIGLLANRSAVGGGRAAPRLLLVFAVFLLMNLLLASGTRSLLERLLSRRRIREVVVLLSTMVWVVPRLLMATGRGRALGRAGAAMQAIGLPWTAAAHAALGQNETLALISLGAWTLLAAWFGRRQFERNLRFDTNAAQATRLRDREQRAGLVEWFYRFPSLVWSDPLAGIVEKELRSLARTPRFRTVFIMGFTFGLAIWFPMIARERSATPSWFLATVCLYALTLLGQVSYWNCFGFDRSAAAFYFAAPQPIAKVLLGKNIAAMVYVYLEVLMVIVVTSIFRLTAGWINAAETLVVMGICALYLMALGNLSSVHYPRAMAPERIAQGGGRGMQGFLFLIYPLALLPVALAYIARYAFDSELMFAIVLAISAIGGGALYAMALRSAISEAVLKRERIVAELSSGADAPVG